MLDFINNSSLGWKLKYLYYVVMVLPFIKLRVIWRKRKIRWIENPLFFFFLNLSRDQDLVMWGSSSKAVPSYCNGGGQKYNHYFLALTLALFKSMGWNPNGCIASWYGPVLPMITPAMEYHQSNVNFGGFTMEQLSSTLLQSIIYFSYFSFLQTATWMLKCVQQNQAQEQFTFST